jgi:hypothetical protein
VAGGLPVGCCGSGGCRGRGSGFAGPGDWRGFAVVHGLLGLGLEVFERVAEAHCGRVWVGLFCLGVRC